MGLNWIAIPPSLQPHAQGIHLVNCENRGYAPGEPTWTSKYKEANHLQDKCPIFIFLLFKWESRRKLRYTLMMRLDSPSKACFFFPATASRASTSRRLAPGGYIEKASSPRHCPRQLTSQIGTWRPLETFCTSDLSSRAQTVFGEGQHPDPPTSGAGRCWCSFVNSDGITGLPRPAATSKSPTWLARPRSPRRLHRALASPRLLLPASGLQFSRSNDSYPEANSTDPPLRERAHRAAPPPSIRGTPRPPPFSPCRNPHLTVPVSYLWPAGTMHDTVGVRVRKLRNPWRSQPAGEPAANSSRSGEASSPSP